MTTINLSKTPKVNLAKGQVVHLTKDGKSTSEHLTNVYFGAKWGSIIHTSRKGFWSKIFRSGESTVKNVDLDASLLLYDKHYELQDTVYYGKRISRDNAIVHSGDDRQGTQGNEVEYDNETISIDFTKINPNIKFIVAILNSYNHYTFDEIPYMKLRIYTGNIGDPDEVLCDYDVENNQSFINKEAIILGYFYKTEGTWKFKADGTTTQERSIKEIAYNSAKVVIKNL